MKKLIMIGIIALALAACGKPKTAWGRDKSDQDWTPNTNTRDYM
jgi:hypothetical protein